MKSCEDFQSLIESYIDNELTREQTHLFEAHISSCNNCREALEFAKSIRQVLTALPEIDVPEDFNSAVMQRIKSECKAPKKSFGLYAKKYGALAACVVLAVVIGGGLSETDFSKGGKSYDDFIVEGTPTPTAVPEASVVIPEQNAGEKQTPTKDNISTAELPAPAAKNKAKQETKAKSEINTVADKPADTSSAKEESIEIDVGSVPSSVEKTTTDSPEPLSLAASYGLEDVSSPIPESAAAAGGGGSARSVISQSTSSVSLAISPEYSEVATGLINEFATAEDGAYTADKASFDKLLNALDIGGITYTVNGAADGDIIVFEVLF